MQQSSPIRVGIIGLGAIGEKLIHAFLKHTETEIVAVCDSAKGRAQLISQSLNGIAWYTDHREMLLHTEVDMVYVAVPPKYHHAIALDVIASGKHILCEKPLANSLAEAHEMFEQAKRAGVVHAMNFPMYYKNVFKEISNYVSSGYVGQLRRVEIITHFHKWPREWQQNEWVGGREQGGFVLEVIPHFIQITQALFGKMEFIQSQLELPDDPTKCEIGILGCMQLADGTPVLVNGVSQIAQREHLSFTIYGTNGTLSLVNWSKLEVGKYGEPLTDISVQPNDNFQELISNMVSAIHGEHADLIDFQTGYEIQKVLEALLQKSP
jgi:predicted dehydrogenase